MPDPEPLVVIHFTLNGVPLEARVPGNLSLLRYLRDERGLMGTKDGCSSGECGACNVLVNTNVNQACQVKMQWLEGSQVETVEGLASGGRLHPIQQAFIDAGAIQCGFCTPGMLMTAKGLLDANPHPTLEEVKASLTQNHNLCRCTGYVKIFDAIRLAGERSAAGIEPQAGDPLTGALPEISHSLVKTIAVDMVTGQNRFCDDRVMPGMLHGKILWAAHPHARILKVDTRAAENMPGVAAVITARDIPGKNQAGIVMRDQVAIAAERVLYIGDAIAAVFAETRDQAEAAVRQIQVDYEVLPGVFTPEQAAHAAPGTQLHPEAKDGNLLHHAEIVRGDVDAAFAQCAVVVEDDYTTPFIEHGFIEPEAGLGYLDADGRLVVELPNQASFEDRMQLAEILAVPEEQIRIVHVPPGGAFGGKEDMILQQFLALGALKTKRPVKMALTRAESLRVHAKRHPSWIHYKTGADREGRILAIQQEITVDTGCYASLGPDVLENMVVFGAGPYYVPNVKLRGWAWYTNNVLAGAMRGFGVNQVAFALEQQMDAMARALGIDPFEFRLKNALDVGLPTAADHVLEDGVVSIKETIEAARALLRETRLPEMDGKRIGVGVASAVKNIGYGHNVPEDAGVILELGADGSVVVKASQHEYGQGARVGLARLAANELGIPPELITVMVPDTAVTPPTGPTTASRQTFLTGNALVMACTELKEDLFGHAAEILGESPQNLHLQGEYVIDPQSGSKVALREMGERFVVQKRYAPPHSDGILPPGQASHYGQPDFHSRVTHFCYAYSTQVAIVAADPETGEVKVLKIISANDVGKALNREAIEGQIQGGVMMGLGFALSEQFIVEQGVNLTDSLVKAGIPSADQTPEIVCAIVEVAHPFGPEGVKGFAEAPPLAATPAIINAIYDALGVRITSLPANKEKVLQALKEKRELHLDRKP